MFQGKLDIPIFQDLPFLIFRFLIMDSFGITYSKSLIARIRDMNVKIAFTFQIIMIDWFRVLIYRPTLASSFHYGRIFTEILGYGIKNNEKRY